MLILALEYAIFYLECAGLLFVLLSVVVLLQSFYLLSFAEELRCFFLRMFGGGFPRGRGGAGNRGRGRGRGSGGQLGARGKGGQAVKRKANFGANHGGKRANASGAQAANQWGADPIPQQPLKQDTDAQWFQDTVEDQWA